MRTYHLSVAVYRCDICLALREEYSLRDLEYIVLRRIFGSKSSTKSLR